MDSILKILKKLSDLRLFFWSTLWLMFLLTIGTIEQKNIGLFLSQEKYFSSLFFYYRNIPLPGGGLIILLMCMGLISQLVFKTNYKNKKKAGIVLTHIGALILLIGSLITNRLAKEGSVIIAEGATINEMLDYREQEFIIRNDSRTLFQRNIKALSSGLVFDLHPGIPAAEKLKIERIFSNCELVPLKKGSGEEQGLARQFSLKELSLSSENTSCIEFSLLKKKGREVYRLFLNMPVSQTLVIGEMNFNAELRNTRYPLPFSIKLLDFEKKFHQGTMISKSFKSDVLLIDGPLESRRTIEMNSPLRYKGYTFYQSSFSENSDGEISEFSVVKNAGQLIPYISSIIICLGIMLHLFINSNVFIKKGFYENPLHSTGKFAYLLALLGFGKKS